MYPEIPYVFELVERFLSESALAIFSLGGGVGWVTKGEQLCLACGMCCDGSLFEKVELAEGESLSSFRDLGLPVKRSRAKRPAHFFHQPCQALCGDCACRVYEDRPRQCREFECAVFKNLAKGGATLEESIRVVKKARRMASRVRRLLSKLDDNDIHLSLDARLRRTHKRLEREGVDAEAAEAFADLGLAMHKLGMLAHERFYTEE